MKRLLLIALGSLAVNCLGQNIDKPSDIRTVSGIKVDLGPLHAWYRTKEGERPLKHWKRLTVLNVKGLQGSWDHIFVRTETGAVAELLAANLPKRVKEYIQTFAQQESELGA